MATSFRQLRTLVGQRLRWSPPCFSSSSVAAVKPSDNPNDTGGKRREDHRRKPLLVHHRHGTKEHGCRSKDHKLKISRTHNPSHGHACALERTLLKLAS
jgi:hypothetical protein